MEWASWFCCVLFLVSLSLCAWGNTRRGVETIDYKPIDSAVDKGKGAPCTSHKKPEEFQRDEQNRHLLPFCWLSHRIVCVCVCVCGPRGKPCKPWQKAGTWTRCACRHGKLMDGYFPWILRFRAPLDGTIDGTIVLGVIVARRLWFVDYQSWKVPAQWKDSLSNRYGAHDAR